ncbi:hypothetical protein HUC00_07520 [Bacillus mycoides]|nr:hypothetical protein [Bacillus mycoides]
MEPPNFIINIENQKCLFNERKDLCSHEEIYLNVDGPIITQMSMDERILKVFLCFLP